jgi:hypothetical protein
MELQKYIEKVGDAAFAKKFGVAERTALAYRCGQRKPRPELAARIVAESPVTWAGIFGNAKQG